MLGINLGFALIIINVPIIIFKLNFNKVSSNLILSLIIFSTLVVAIIYILKG